MAVAFPHWNRLIRNISKEWSKAAKAGSDTFVYAGRSFNTKGGTAKK